MHVNGISVQNKSVSFGGYKRFMNENGFKVQKFFYPFDPDRYDVEVEFYDATQDKKGNVLVTDTKKPVFKMPLDPQTGLSDEFDPDDYFRDKDKFAYRFRIKDKVDGSEKFAFDAGKVTNPFSNESKDKFNVIFQNRSVINKSGPMHLIMVDEYYPGYVRNPKTGKIEMDKALREKALGSVRTHTNKLGGNFLGVIKMLPDLAKQGYKRIVGMPFTKDTLSSHLYWTQNAVQLAPQFGTMEDFKEMQVELFKNDMNWVADAALVNEGLEGVHFSHVLKWGEKSPYYNWFKVTGLENGVLSLGVIPNKENNSEFVRFKLVNAPVKLVGEKLEKNDKYNPAKPTYLQLYDERLASKEQQTNDKIIQNYDKNNTNNSYEIADHNDTIYPYYFEIKPEEFMENVAQYKKEKHTSDVNFKDVETMKQLFRFENFKIIEKSEGGFELWDGNSDIPKLNFYLGHMDQEFFNKFKDNKDDVLKKYSIGVNQVQDYAVSSGQYWTKLVADTQFEYLENVLRGVKSNPKSIMEELKSKAGKDIPASVLDVMDENIVKNILDKNYEFPRLKGLEPKNDYVLKNIMGCQIDSLPVGDDVLSILASPYISKRATIEEEIGSSRFDIYTSGYDNLPDEYKTSYLMMDQVYKQDVLPILIGTLSNINKNMQLFDGENVTDLGKYVIQEIVPDLTQYLLIKSLDPNAEIKTLPNGKFDFSSVDSESINLKALKIKGITPKDEAVKVVSTMKKNLKGLAGADTQELFTKQLKIRLKGANEVSYKLADVIMDRNEAGLGWRIDAAKDVASIDAVRNKKDNILNAWESAIKFWTKFNQNVLKINPHAYTTAEITDLGGFIPETGLGRFASSTDAEQKFIEETGITSIANYSYFYSSIPGLYAASAENGKQRGEFNNIAQIKKTIDGVDSSWKSNPGFLFHSPLDAVIHSYTFIGNHDKPRPLHFLALDMSLYFSDFSKDEHRDVAATVLQKDKANIDFLKLKAKGIAMGLRLRQAFADTCTDSNEIEAINKAIANMSSGKFNGKVIDSDAFANRPFEMVISDVLDEASRLGLKMGKVRKNELGAKTLGVILTPAYDKYYSIYKTMVTLPGEVTDFAGDKQSLSGFETKAKNYGQQNRNIIRHEWLEDPGRPYVKEFYDNMNNILALRKNPKLSALNDGIPVSVRTVQGKDKKETVYPLLRYNDKGSVVLTLYTTTGADLDNNKPMNRDTVRVDKLEIDTKDKVKEGLFAGIKNGTQFKSTRPGDNSVYRIYRWDNTGAYTLQRFSANGEVLPIEIKPSDYNALVLYKE